MKYSNIKKLVLIALTFAGLGTQVGCGYIALESCPNTTSAIYSVTFQNPNFIEEAVLKVNYDEWCDEGSIISNQTIEKPFGGWAGFAQNLNDYDPNAQYSLLINCEQVSTLVHNEISDPEWGVPASISCNLVFDSSIDSQDLNLDLNLEYQGQLE